MKKYNNYNKKKFNPYLLVIIATFIVFNLILYFFDSRVLPSVVQISETLVKSRASDVISNTCIDVFNKNFNANDIIEVDKDGSGNIKMIRTNTGKLNKLIGSLSLKCNEKLRNMGEEGIQVPFGWVTEQSVYYEMGPMIKFRVEPVGNLEMSYESKFEGAGMNQTRHKIILNVKAKMRIIIPMNSREVVVDNQIPIAETIIVGSIPFENYGTNKNN